MMKSKYFLRVISLLVLFVSFLPVNNAGALAPTAPPPVDMFQLPWDQGIAWVAIDGIDNGSKRPASSSHNYRLGGAIDFAPKSKMTTGEDTSNFWVTAAAAGVVVERSSCHLSIAHDNGWLTQYQFLGNIRVSLGDTVSRNQRLAIIADGVRYKYCPGYEEINVPHLHFMLRPSIIGASFAGWEVKYSSLFNTTTFTKGLTTVGLFKPLLNVLDSQPTPTPTAPQTATATPGSGTPSATPSPTSSVLTLSKAANPQTYVQVGQIISYNFTITNTGATSLGPAQFVINDNKLGGSLPCGPANSTIATNQTLNCTVNYSITQADMSVASLTNTATASGAGQTSAPATATITNLTMLATPTPTLSGPYVSTAISPRNINLGETALVTVSLNNVPTEGYTSAEFTCTYNVNLFEASNINVASLFGADPVVAINGPHAQSLIVAIAGSKGNKATTSGAVFTFDVKGVQVGQTVIECRARVSQGNNALTEIPFVVDYLTILGSSPTPNLTPSHTPTFTPTPVDSPTQPVTPVPFTPSPTPLPTSTVPSDWLTFINSTYDFQFKYPPQSQIVSGGTDNFTRIDLPFVQGTNLREKYLEMIVVENADPCHSPLATSSILQTSEIVVINGISFVKETGGDAGVGHLHQWVAYSTSRDNICVSLDFILHSLNPGNFATPPPVFDYAAESSVFGQIVSTYAWLSLSTATPTASQSTPVGTATPTSSTPVGSATSTSPIPTDSPTPTSIPGNSGILTGQVLASKPVTVSLYDATDTLVTSMTANANGTFTLTTSAGTYTVRAAASGFLNAEATITLAGNTITMPTITLLAGDIDGNNVIDQFDAMTIGMNYNTASPTAADLNNDGIINVLDLELLAGNYRKTGPLPWE